MKLIGNILWFFFTGLATSIMWFFLGLGWCITIVGIPFGLQAFKFAKLSLAPFGKTVQADFFKHAILNAIWFLLGGFSLALTFFFTGLFWCITIIGIPFGKQCFKMAKLSIAPFGATVS